MKRKIIVTFFIIVLIIIFVLYFYSYKMMPLLIRYSKIKSKKIAIDIISKNVSDDVVKILDKEDLFLVERDNLGNIETVDYNSKVVNKILSDTSKRVVKNFQDLKSINNGIIMKIPVGIISNNVFIQGLGPKIPVKIILDGNVLTSLDTKVKEYGVNSALIEVSVKIEANIDVIIPFKTSEIKVINNVPISLKIAKGNVSSILNSK